MTRQLKGHTNRIGALCWNNNILTSGSRDKHILNRDFRTNHNFEAKMTGHRDEICGIKWSHNGQ